MALTLGSESDNGPVDDGDLPGMYAWSMYCMSSARCDFCNFSLVPGDKIILALFDGISNELTYVPNTSIVSGADHVHKNHYKDHSKYRTRIEVYGIFMGNSHGKQGVSQRNGNNESSSGHDCLADAAHPSCFSIALRFGFKMPTVPAKIERGTGNVYIRRADCRMYYAGPRGFGAYSGLLGGPDVDENDNDDSGSDDPDDPDVPDVPDAPNYPDHLRRPEDRALYNFLTFAGCTVAMPDRAEEHKRYMRIKNDLAQRLANKLYPGALPLEMWHMVAENLVHECAYVTMNDFVTSGPGDIFSYAYLDRSVFASFVRMEDSVYVEALFNRENEDNKVEGGKGKNAVLIFPGLSAATNSPYYVRIYTAYDAVGCRCLRMFPVKDAADFDKPTQSEKMWWKLVSQAHMDGVRWDCYMLDLAAYPSPAFGTMSDRRKICEIEMYSEGNPVENIECRQVLHEMLGDSEYNGPAAGPGR